MKENRFKVGRGKLERGSKLKCWFFLYSLDDNPILCKGLALSHPQLWSKKKEVKETVDLDQCRQLSSKWINIELKGHVSPSGCNSEMTRRKQGQTSFDLPARQALGANRFDLWTKNEGFSFRHVIIICLALLDRLHACTWIAWPCSFMLSMKAVNNWKKDQFSSLRLCSRHCIMLSRTGLLSITVPCFCLILTQNTVCVHEG